ncbi:uncharacterized protein LOC114932068 [Nylanderia fulva]|uniref:uncharacterized protein LOC114932068 n=1 Tax=Nylanderia fulva TaxID=613905 RepID=UPI0010FAFA3B|nr:uncharacterized protein LOC114932068 [Nylanderia fulva]
MKDIYVIAVAFLASWSVCAASEYQPYTHQLQPQDNVLRKCPYPDINPSNTTTNIAHESDCTKFYKCLLGEGTVIECPLLWPNDKTKRLHYNRAVQVCDWPWNAGCESCPPKGSNGKYPPESKIQDPDSTDCRKYIVCKNGKQTKKTCPKKTCFSRTCQDCVEKRKGGKCDDDDDDSTTDESSTDESSTDDSSTDESSTDDSSTDETTDESDDSCEEGDQKAHDCNCAKFYECSEDGDWELNECDGGLHFSPTKKKCMSADKAKCKKKK